MFVLDRLKNRMQEMGIRPNKTLGQNFLVSQNVIDKIIQAAVHCEAKEYIEVGPGPGALTDLLLENQLKP
ncbi:MAG: rRNA adenine N-6-methyltransferase family protein, partial [Bdellovibrionota bacterium]